MQDICKGGLYARKYGRRFRTLKSTYVGDNLYVAAERRFIAWKQVHSYLHSSFETFIKAVEAGNAAGVERELYEDLLGLSVLQPGGCTKTISQAMVAVHENMPLSVCPGLWATNFTARSTKWHTHVRDLTNLQPMTKVMPGTAPDSLYTWLNSVPVEDTPFVTTRVVERGTQALKEL